MTQYFASDEKWLREAIDDLANQLGAAGLGFDFTVKAKTPDETLDKLTMLVNFVIETARKRMGELKERNDRLAELDRMKSAFLANVSHELRTPLQLIVGPIEQLLSEEGVSKTQADRLEVVRYNARTLLKSVSELLDITKLEAGKMSIFYAETDVSRLVRLTSAHFDALAQERKIEFVVNVPKEMIAEVDPEKVQRVVLNVLSNAFKFVADGGIVHCTLKLLDGKVLISVEDNGPGIKPELRSAVFERFRQADDAPARNVGGTGLGLALVREFVEMHRGSVRIVDGTLGGACLRIELPVKAPLGTHVEPEGVAMSDTGKYIVQGTLEELRWREHAQSTPPPAVERGTLPRVMVVEDHAEMRRFIVETLTGDFEAIAAMNGKDALDKISIYRPDVVLTDLSMPIMSGEELCFSIRLNPESANLPIILLTGKSDDQLRDKLLSEVAQDYVTKPFSPTELKARVRNQVKLKRARDLLENELSIRSDDLELLVNECNRRKRQLKVALDAAEAARHEADQAHKVKDDLLKLVSHEIHTPLTTILLTVETIGKVRPPLDPQEQRAVQRLEASSQRLKELTDTLLEFSRLGSGRANIAVESLCLKALAQESVDELMPQAKNKGLELKINVTTELPPAISDARLIRLILTNLIGNAIKYTRSGSIEVILDIERNEHVISVRDTGPGIPEQDQSRIFQPFQQLAPGRGGVGLGLALVYQVVRALGGQIGLESKVGMGSTFTVRIPLQEPAANVAPLQG